MSNKTELQNNNLELSEILGDINALPNAGGGGVSPTLVPVTVGNWSGNNSYDVIYTTLENGEIIGKTLTIEVNSGADTVINCVATTSLIVYFTEARLSCDGFIGLDLINEDETFRCFLVLNEESAAVDFS